MVKFTGVEDTKRFFISLLQFIAVIVGGTVVVLIVSQFIGYLPYSDRPGPGWIGAFPIRSFGNAANVVGFALEFGALCLLPAAIYGSFVVAVARILEWAKVRRWIVATASALVAGFVSQLIVAGVGWLIAISWVPVVAATVFGVVYGAWLLPTRALQPTEPAG